MLSVLLQHNHSPLMAQGVKCTQTEYTLSVGYDQYPISKEVFENAKDRRISSMREGFSRQGHLLQECFTLQSELWEY